MSAKLFSFPSSSCLKKISQFHPDGGRASSSTCGGRASASIGKGVLGPRGAMADLDVEPEASTAPPPNDQSSNLHAWEGEKKQQQKNSSSSENKLGTAKGKSYISGKGRKENTNKDATRHNNTKWAHTQIADNNTGTINQIFFRHWCAIWLTMMENFDGW